MHFRIEHFADILCRQELSYLEHAIHSYCILCLRGPRVIDCWHDWLLWVTTNKRLVLNEYSSLFKPMLLQVVYG